MADTKQKEDSEQWYLRINGESVFGPVATPGLILWAEQGRVLPGHEVSQDRKKWLPAESVGFLEMRWFVDDGKGELRGPLNKKAAEALVASGKVPSGSQIVSADEVETSAPSKAVPQPQPAADTSRQRIAELEVLVTSLKEKLSKFTSQGSLEAVVKERDALAEQLKTSETQREVLVRTAEKESRAWERKLEAARQQLKKFEAQAEEAKHAQEASADLLHQADAQKEQATVAATELKALQDRAEDSERAARDAAQALAEAQKTTGQTKAALIEKEKELEALKSSVAQAAAQARADAQTAAGQTKAALIGKEKELEALKSSIAQAVAQARADAQTAADQTKAALIEKEKELEALKSSVAQAVAQARAETAEECQKKYGKQISDAEAGLNELENLRVELSTAKKAWAESTNALKAADAAQQRAEAAAKASEQAYSELLTASNERDAAYQKKIAGFEKLSSLTPEEIEKFYADRAAIYELVKAEVDELASSLEAERRYFEQIKQTSQRRLESMAEHRQELMLQLGTGPEDMTRRTLREQPTDPQNARLRAELENLKVTSQREEQFAATRDQELRQKLRLLESENAHLKESSSDAERTHFQLQDLQDQLSQRQKELEDERRKSDEVVKTFEESKAALLARIDALEKKSGPAETDSARVSDSVGSKLATFMRLKR
jgi:hypothetical protein